MKFIEPPGGWKTFTEPRPYVTTSGFAFDNHGRFPILFRGPTVRSARNCWSLPSGLHEPGRTLAQQFSVELAEECNLRTCPDLWRHLGVYENIAPELSSDPTGPQWHWVIHLLAIRVESLEPFRNSEPDKHPKSAFITLADLDKYAPWAPGLGPMLPLVVRDLARAIEDFTD